jgi:small ligand-binding sensory domain FIST
VDELSPLAGEIEADESYFGGTRNGKRGRGAAGKVPVFTYLARGPHMFGAQSADLAAIQDELGEVPLVGFICNGKILHNRVYNYTGVLALFL